LICDDRPDVRRELSQVFQLRSPGPVESVGAGSDLLSIYETRSPVQVMIGVHPGSTFGVDALDLLLAQHPTASPVVYGSRRDVEFLAGVYARGAAGLLLWEIGDH
jgi:DNA-binding NarL/FixJ family response regulator